MSNKNLIIDKQAFQDQAEAFLEVIFGQTLSDSNYFIEIRTFSKWSTQNFYDNVQDAINQAYKLCNEGIDVYFGVNPRDGNGGAKKNIHYIATFHAEVDYGIDGHKKAPEYETFEEALEAIQSFPTEPTIIIHSGGGFHCYWVLNEPASKDEIGLEQLEIVNRALLKELKADLGTHDITRVLRIPGTFNFKQPGSPRLVNIISSDGPKYDLEDFEKFMHIEEPGVIEPPEIETDIEFCECQVDELRIPDIAKLPVTDRIKTLIKKGNDGSYPSRSEADQAVITSLVNKNIHERDIKKIFQAHRIGEKYREHNSPDKYLKHCIQQAKKFSDLTEEEMQDPLFISGSIIKIKDRYVLKTVKFQVYMTKKYYLKYLDNENAFFRYNGYCYEHCTEKFLNNLCQKELDNYREFFTPAALKEFIHFSIGYNLVNSQQTKADQVRYITFENCLFDIQTHSTINHSASIFTTNLLPYDFDPDASCPRWLQFLDEVFYGNKEIIMFIQEAVGYALHKEIPKPAIFFLVGSGSNGKSVFIDTITSLFGETNACNISLNSLSKEQYLLGLFGKMINISSETPQKKQINTDIVKAVVAGDWVTGKEIYRPPHKFKPYAKHYLAMNEIPIIEDMTHGMWRRLYLIEFPRTFSEDEMDVFLTNKLREELSGIFNWALEGYKRLIAKKFIFSTSANMTASKKNYKEQSNSALSFAAKTLTKPLENYGKTGLKFGEVFKMYEEYCSQERIKNPYNKGEFKTALLNENYEIGCSSKDGNQVHIFGVELKK